MLVFVNGHELLICNVCVEAFEVVQDLKLIQTAQVFEF